MCSAVKAGQRLQLSFDIAFKQYVRSFWSCCKKYVLLQVHTRCEATVPTLGCSSSMVQTDRHNLDENTLSCNLKNLLKVYASPSADAYKDCFLQKLSPGILGHHLEKHCRALYNSCLYPEASEPRDAPRGLCVNGRSRGAASTSCDFMVGSHRVEVKASKLGCKASRLGWCFKWINIKQHAFDRLILIGYTPKHVYFWEWDGKTGLSGSGRSTSCGGHQISIGASGIDWQVAFESIMQKCVWRLLHSQKVRDVPQPSISPMQAVYGKDNLAHLTPYARGNVLAHLCRELYSEVLYPGACIPHDPPCGTGSDGRRLGANNAECDFMSGSIRVEVKSSMLHYIESRKSYRCAWMNVKSDLFDRLILITYAPGQIVFWEWDGTRTSRDGTRTNIYGHRIMINVRADCWQKAFEKIRRRAPGALLSAIALPSLDKDDLALPPLGSKGIAAPAQ